MSFKHFVVGLIGVVAAFFFVSFIYSGTTGAPFDARLWLAPGIRMPRALRMRQATSPDNVFEAAPACQATCGRETATAVIERVDHSSKYRALGLVQRACEHEVQPQACAMGCQACGAKTCKLAIDPDSDCTYDLVPGEESQKQWLCRGECTCVQACAR